MAKAIYDGPSGPDTTAKRGRQADRHNEDEDVGRGRRRKVRPGAEASRNPPIRYENFLFIYRNCILFMPIVNGSFVPDTLPGAMEAQRQVFGEYSRRDMSDYSTAAYNYLMKQQEQAYNLELWNLTNEYNSPAAQMKRYQDAGLNPNLIYGQSNTAQAPASASAAGFRPGNLRQKQTANAMDMIGQFRNIVAQAKDIWDYAKYGSEQHRLQNLTEFYRGALTKYQAGVAQINEKFENWLLGSSDTPDYSVTRRGQMYDVGYRIKQGQADLQDANYQRVLALTKMIPDQQARLAALRALDEYRLRILQGQNDAVLNIHTGNETADAFLRAFIYFGMSRI